MATKKPGPPFLSSPAVTRAVAESVKKPPAATRPETAAELVERAERLRAQVDQSSYELGLTLRELQRRYTELRFKSFEELLQKRELMSRQTAHKLIAIVNAFDRHTALALGTEKAYQVIRYTREKHRDLPAKQQLLRHAGVDTERVTTRHRRHKPSVIRIELTLEEAEDLVTFLLSRRARPPR